MLKDIPQLQVENVIVAVVREMEEGENVWNVYIINLYPDEITGVLVSSAGYGQFEGRDVKTSVLRHMIGNISSNDYGKIEPIMENLFGLTNEFWVSFFLNKHMYDKKYIFLPESIKEENFTMVPVLGKMGVMIR
ncbi:MAG: hypothetical protein IPP51_04705 [Bacteroidetes bacterium]|nr:hypothetical protein [Bacteroidota bacterium]